MGWRDGQWVAGVSCEDAPCCGCCGLAVENADSSYYEERWHEDQWGIDDYEDIEEDEESVAIA